VFVKTIAQYWLKNNPSSAKIFGKTQVDVGKKISLSDFNPKIALARVGKKITDQRWMEK